MPELWIPSGTGHSDFTVRKSRFIGEAGLVESVREARDRVKELRLEHPGSRHVSWAYILGKDAALKGLSDDGEPRGTAGRPIMDFISGGSFTDTLVTVVRYFGGVKLGTGGLTSAYGRCSREALEKMPKIPFVERCRVDLTIGYPVYEQISRLINEAGGLIVDEVFGSDIRFSADLPVSVLEEIRRMVKDVSRGTAGFEVEKNE
jgi:uncharacterized YigZ family protein